jgi:hypothetical protein
MFTVGWFIVDWVVLQGWSIQEMPPMSLLLLILPADSS